MTTEDTINLIMCIVGNDFDSKVLFENPVKIKKSPHSWPVIVHGIKVGMNSNVWLLDATNEWQLLEPSMKDSDLISNSVLQRIKSLSSVNSDKHSTS